MAEAKIVANAIPKHFQVQASLDADGMFELIMSLRRFVDEFDAPEVTAQLLEALETAYDADLPQRITVLPGMDDDDNGEEAYES